MSEEREGGNDEKPAHIFLPHLSYSRKEEERKEEKKEKEKRTSRRGIERCVRKGLCCLRTVLLLASQPRSLLRKGGKRKKKGKEKGIEMTRRLKKKREGRRATCGFFPPLSATGRGKGGEKGGEEAGDRSCCKPTYRRGEKKGRRKERNREPLLDVYCLPFSFVSLRSAGMRGKKREKGKKKEEKSGEKKERGRTEDTVFFAALSLCSSNGIPEDEKRRRGKKKRAGVIAREGKEGTGGAREEEGAVAITRLGA